MNQSVSIKFFADKIRTIYQNNPFQSETMIERYIEERWMGFPPTERQGLLRNLIKQFEKFPSITETSLPFRGEEFSNLFTLLLGERVSGIDFSSPELPEKLALSLNTIFDTLNNIIEVIQVTLFGKKVELETIRQILSSRLEAEGGTDSLQNYLNQIQEAFLVAHRAFQQSAQTKMGEILTELNPERIEAEAGGTKLGPFRKANLYETYKEKYQTCWNWFESGRFRGELLKEFERVCQKQYQIE